MDGWLTQGVVTTKIYCRPDEAHGDAIVRHLGYRAPLDAQALLEFFGRRAVPGVEELDGDVFRRSLRLAHGHGVAEIRPLADRIALRLHLDDARDEDESVTRVRAMLDLDADPDAVAEALGTDPLMRPLVNAAPGRRVPGAADAEEIAIRAVLGQQVSLAGAATLAGRLVAAYGEPLAIPVGGVTHAFPTSSSLASADGDWPMPASRVRAIRGLAAALASGELALDPAADRRATEDRLLALPGIGPWTVGYIAMRALHDIDAFLPSDLGVRHALDRLGLDSRPAAAELISLAWRPYRAYALQHLWAVAS
jgi:AraC family transcriptional regulator of adaptative response / DNA-3-methyladenine glycosylase II